MLSVWVIANGSSSVFIYSIYIDRFFLLRMMFNYQDTTKTIEGIISFIFLLCILMQPMM